ncbi:unnamed protein product, partial [Closterium sp. NIES-64]
MGTDCYRLLLAPSHLLTEPSRRAFSQSLLTKPSATRIAAGNVLAGAAAGATGLLVTYLPPDLDTHLPAIMTALLSTNEVVATRFEAKVRNIVQRLVR